MDCHWINFLLLLTFVTTTFAATTASKNSSPATTLAATESTYTSNVSLSISTSALSTTEQNNSLTLTPVLTESTSNHTGITSTSVSTTPGLPSGLTSTTTILTTQIIAATTDSHFSNTTEPMNDTNSNVSSSSSTLVTASIGDNSSTTSNFTITTADSVSTNTTVFETGTSTSQTEPTSTAASTNTDTLTTTVATTTVSSLLKVKISETNFLLTDPDNDTYFVELEVVQDVSVCLVILDASLTTKNKPLLTQNIDTSKSNNGILIFPVNGGIENWSEIKNVTSVLIALYANEVYAANLTMDGLYDFLLYSSDGIIDHGLSEQFYIIEKQKLIIDYKKLRSQTVSLSRCSDDGVANTAAVLTKQSPNETNFCNLTVNQTLEMKLTKNDQHCNFPDNLNKTLADSVISEVNSREQCGFAFHMLSVDKVNKFCNGKGKEIDVEFTVRSAFDDQLTIIIQSFLTRTNLDVDGEVFDMHSCSENCLSTETPATKPDNDRIRVTVAVVVSCIGVFLLVLLLVVLYLRRKKKGILQFHMSRLDEDDDLIGDMDDFVGNQGPTFRSFR